MYCFRRHADCKCVHNLILTSVDSLKMVLNVRKKMDLDLEPFFLILKLFNVNLLQQFDPCPILLYALFSSLYFICNMQSRI